MFIDELSKPAFWTVLKEIYTRLDALRQELDQAQALRRKCDTSEAERLLSRELEGYRIGFGHQLQKFEITRQVVESQHVELASDLPILDGITLSMFDPIDYAKACRKVAFAIRAKSTDTTRKTTSAKKSKKRSMNVAAIDCCRRWKADKGKTPMKTIVEDYVEECGGKVSSIMRVLNDNPDQWKDDI